jgi:hypothetical protein
MTRAKPKRITTKHSMAFRIRINKSPLRYCSETESRVYFSIKAAYKSNLRGLFTTQNPVDKIAYGNADEYRN